MRVREGQWAEELHQSREKIVPDLTFFSNRSTDTRSPLYIILGNSHTLDLYHFKLLASLDILCYKICFCWTSSILALVKTVTYLMICSPPYTILVYCFIIPHSLCMYYGGLPYTIRSLWVSIVEVLNKLKY